MTFLHFINCAVLLIGPSVVIFYATRLYEARAFLVCLYGGFAYAGTQLLKMILLATFMPNATGIASFDVAQELLKVVTFWVDLGVMGFALSRIPGRDRELRVLGIGLGWGTAEAIAQKIIPLWIHARQPEWDWSHLRSVLESNANLVQALCLVSLVSWYTIWYRRAQFERQARMCLFILVGYTLVSSVLESFLRLYLQIDPWMLLAYHFVCVGILWLLSSRQTETKV